MTTMAFGLGKPSPGQKTPVHPAVGWIMDNSAGSRANNIYSPASDKVTEVQLFMSTSCQPGSLVIQAISDVEKLLLVF